MLRPLLRLAAPLDSLSLLVVQPPLAIVAGAGRDLWVIDQQTQTRD